MVARVLTIRAHDRPHSFCHAIRQRCTGGLREGGRTAQVAGLHAIGFDPGLSYSTLDRRRRLLAALTARILLPHNGWTQAPRRDPGLKRYCV